MQDLIDRAAMHEDSDIEAIREITVSQSVEGSEPTPRVMTDGGRPRSSAWRSPLGGPRSDLRPRDEKPEPDWEAIRREDLGLDEEDSEEVPVATDGGEPDGQDKSLTEAIREADADEAEDVLDEFDPFIDTEGDE